MTWQDWRQSANGPVLAVIEDVLIECRTWGSPPDAAPTIVLLHEGLGSVGLWRGFPELLAGRTGCGVFAYSRPGYGRSDPVVLPRPLDYMTREARGLLPAMLDLAGCRTAFLVGHSDGASIAAIYAGEHDDARVRGLGLIAPHFFTEPSGLAAIAVARERYETGDLRDRLARHHASPDNAFRGWNDAWLDPGFGDWNIEHVLPAIRVPVLAAQGRDDPYGTAAQIEALARGLLAPLAIEWFEDCGHAPHVECPEALVDAVARFLARLEPAG